MIGALSGPGVTFPYPIFFQKRRTPPSQSPTKARRYPEGFCHQQSRRDFIFLVVPRRNQHSLDGFGDVTPSAFRQAHAGDRQRRRKQRTTMETWNESTPALLPPARTTTARCAFRISKKCCTDVSQPTSTPVTAVTMAHQPPCTRCSPLL